MDRHAVEYTHQTPLTALAALGPQEYAKRKETLQRRKQKEEEVFQSKTGP